MGSHKDKPVITSQSAAGRVTHDGRGRNVWQWNDARIDIDSTTILLKRLDNDQLQLEPTISVPIPTQGKSSSHTAPRAPSRAQQGRITKAPSASDLTLSESMRVEMGGGFDPYNRT
jgi:hypothetical protein